MMGTENKRRNRRNRRNPKQNLISLAGFQRWMEPSARPPAMTPRGNSSCKLLPPIAPKVPHDKRLKRSAVTQELSTGRSNSVLAKSSLSNSKLADELKLRSMAPAIVPTAIICAIGANATVADLWIDFNAIVFSPASTHHSPSPPLQCTHTHTHSLSLSLSLSLPSLQLFLRSVLLPSRSEANQHPTYKLTTFLLLLFVSKV
jgi:hypothetical protein